MLDDRRYHERSKRTLDFIQMLSAGDGGATATSTSTCGGSADSGPSGKGSSGGGGGGRNGARQDGGSVRTGVDEENSCIAGDGGGSGGGSGGGVYPAGLSIQASSATTTATTGTAATTANATIARASIRSSEASSVPEIALRTGTGMVVQYHASTFQLQHFSDAVHTLQKVVADVSPSRSLKL